MWPLPFSLASSLSSGLIDLIQDNPLYFFAWAVEFFLWVKYRHQRDYILSIMSIG